MKKILPLCILIMAVPSHAGINGFTAHSRANCVNNESISWDYTHDWYLVTQSKHYHKSTSNLIHTISTPPEWTWRSAAVHWRESYPGGQWLVEGFHLRHYTDGVWRLEAKELVDTCSKYDGWWTMINNKR